MAVTPAAAFVTGAANLTLAAVSVAGGGVTATFHSAEGAFVPSPAASLRIERCLVVSDELPLRDDREGAAAGTTRAARATRGTGGAAAAGGARPAIAAVAALTAEA